MSKVLTSRRGWFALSATALGTALLSGCADGTQGLKDISMRDFEVDGKSYPVTAKFYNSESKEYALCTNGVCDFTDYMSQARKWVAEHYENTFLPRKDAVYTALSGSYDKTKPLMAIIENNFTYNELLSSYFDGLSEETLAYNKQGTALKDFISTQNIDIYGYQAQVGYVRIGRMYIDGTGVEPMTYHSTNDYDTYGIIAEDKFRLDQSLARALNFKPGSA